HSFMCTLPDFGYTLLRRPAASPADATLGSIRRTFGSTPRCSHEASGACRGCTGRCASTFVLPARLAGNGAGYRAASPRPSRRAPGVHFAHVTRTTGRRPSTGLQAANPATTERRDVHERTRPLRALRRRRTERPIWLASPTGCRPRHRGRPG